MKSSLPIEGDWAPDGSQKIVYSIYNPSTVTEKIYVLAGNDLSDFATVKTKKISPNGMDAFDPHWQPLPISKKPIPDPLGGGAAAGAGGGGLSQTIPGAQGASRVSPVINPAASGQLLLSKVTFTQTAFSAKTIKSNPPRLSFHLTFPTTVRMILKRNTKVIGETSFKGKLGANSHKFTGQIKVTQKIKVKGKIKMVSKIQKIKPGKYRGEVVAIGGSKGQSKPALVGFTYKR